MKSCTKCGAEKPRSEFRKNRCTKDGLHAWCKTCARAGDAAHYAANKEKMAAASTAWRRANPERAKAIKAAWAAANHDVVTARAAAWRRANPERARATKAAWARANRERLNARSATWYWSNLEKARATKAAWEKANPHKVNAKTAARYAAKLQATPVWADKRFIELWYKGASIMTQLTGKPYHVDHVVPLKSKLVCGLHVPANMQILPGADNSAKGNRYWPDMP